MYSLAIALITITFCSILVHGCGLSGLDWQYWALVLCFWGIGGCGAAYGSRKK